MPSIGSLEIALVVLVLFFVFGPRRLPAIGRSVGGGLHEFTDAMTIAAPTKDASDVAARVIDRDGRDETTAA
jgi:TatA/E family protein of Tat protein translocase